MPRRLHAQGLTTESHQEASRRRRPNCLRASARALRQPHPGRKRAASIDARSGSGGIRRQRSPSGPSSSGAPAPANKATKPFTTHSQSMTIATGGHEAMAAPTTVCGSARLGNWAPRQGPMTSAQGAPSHQAIAHAPRANAPSARSRTLPRVNTSGGSERAWLEAVARRLHGLRSFAITGEEAPQHWVANLPTNETVTNADLRLLRARPEPVL